MAFLRRKGKASNDPSRLVFFRKLEEDEEDQDGEISFLSASSAQGSTALLGSDLLVDASMVYSEEGTCVSGLTVDSNPSPIFSAKSLGGSAGLLLNLSHRDPEREELESLTTNEDEEHDLGSATSSFYSKNDHYFSENEEQPYIFTDEGSPQSPESLNKISASPMFSLMQLATPAYKGFRTPPKASIASSEEASENQVRASPTERGRMLAKNLLQRLQIKGGSPEQEKDKKNTSSKESSESSSVGSSDDTSDDSSSRGQSTGEEPSSTESSEEAANLPVYHGSKAIKPNSFANDADDEASSISYTSSRQRSWLPKVRGSNGSVSSSASTISSLSVRPQNRRSRFRRALGSIRNRRLTRRRRPTSPLLSKIAIADNALAAFNLDSEKEEDEDVVTFEVSPSGEIDVAAPSNEEKSPYSEEELLRVVMEALHGSSSEEEPDECRDSGSFDCSDPEEELEAVENLGLVSKMLRQQSKGSPRSKENPTKSLDRQNSSSDADCLSENGREASSDKPVIDKMEEEAVQKCDSELPTGSKEEKNKGGLKTSLQTLERESHDTKDSARPGKCPEAPVETAKEENTKKIGKRRTRKSHARKKSRSSSFSEKVKKVKAPEKEVQSSPERPIRKRALKLFSSKQKGSPRRHVKGKEDLSPRLFSTTTPQKDNKGTPSGGESPGEDSTSTMTESCGSLDDSDSVGEIVAPIIQESQIKPTSTETKNSQKERTRRNKWGFKRTKSSEKEEGFFPQRITKSIVKQQPGSPVVSTTKTSSPSRNWAILNGPTLSVYSTSALDTRATTEDIAAQLGVAREGCVLLERFRNMASDPELIQAKEDVIYQNEGTTKKDRSEIPILQVTNTLTVPHYEKYVFSKLREFGRCILSDHNEEV